MCEHPLAARYEYCWDSMVSNLWPQKSDRRLLKLNLSLKPKGTVPRLSKIGLEKNTQFLEEKGEKNVRTKTPASQTMAPKSSVVDGMDFQLKTNSMAVSPKIAHRIAS